MIELDRASLTKDTVEVLHSLSFCIRAGESWAILGPTAAGKTSLLELLGGVHAPSAGRVQVNGISQQSIFSVTGIGGAEGTHATNEQWPPITVREFLSVCGLAANHRGSRLRTILEQSLERTGLHHFAHRRIATLSIGSRQRLLLARAILEQPFTLLLDDPYAHLDPDGHLLLDEVVNDLTLSGGIVAASIHDANLSSAWSHVAFLVNGRLVCHGAADHQTLAPGFLWTYQIECPRNSSRASEIVRKKLRSPVDEIDIHRIQICPSIDEPRLPEVLQFLFHAGIDIHSADIKPPWPVQLIKHFTRSGQPNSNDT